MINKSRLFKRAWYLVKNQGYNLSWALKKVWSEMKEYIAEKANEKANEHLPEYQGSKFYFSEDAMREFYMSNAYKGD